ncbi:hypothetical protein BRAS3843_2560017 [Bradyrhizobium sp. STM 3843]|nr:hypothetical protein BRAS3843_2560017 [Bradyrhizobium sp. STM 3843]
MRSWTAKSVGELPVGLGTNAIGFAKGHSSQPANAVESV